MTSKASAKADSEARSLTGAEKVAVLLLALGRPKAAKLLKRFDADDIRLITQAANGLPQITSGDLAELVEEFGKIFSGGVNFVGTSNEVKSLLADVMSEEEISAVLTERADAASSEEPVWVGFSRLKDDALRGYLVSEHPQVAALILSRIDAGVAARVMGTLPTELRNVLLWRMLALKAVAEDALAALEAVLRQDLIALSSSNNSVHANIAGILNRLDKTQTEAALQLLGEVRPADVRALRNMLFTFEDLPALSQMSLTVLINQIPVDQLVVALSGTDPEFQNPVLAVLGTRARRMLEAELQSGKGASPREIADARRAIVDQVLKLSAQGQLELPSTDASEAA